jgi:hypothetical protein
LPLALINHSGRGNSKAFAASTSAAAEGKHVAADVGEINY